MNTYALNYGSILSLHLNILGHNESRDFWLKSLERGRFEEKKRIWWLLRHIFFPNRLRKWACISEGQGSALRRQWLVVSGPVSNLKHVCICKQSDDHLCITRTTFFCTVTIYIMSCLTVIDKTNSNLQDSFKWDVNIVAVSYTTIPARCTRFVVFLSTVSLLLEINQFLHTLMLLK